MSYLEPPPMPAPVIVMKDFGGFVTDYQARTEQYRASDREVRLHECHSACTLALSLPNVCVYPNSVLKFHLAYDPRNHQSDYGVSQELFNSYPAAVRARLGTLTRQFKVLSGAELINLGIRNCNAPHNTEPRVLVAARTPSRPAPKAATEQDGTFSGIFRGVMSVFKPAETAPVRREYASLVPPTLPKPAPIDALAGEIPLPPRRPAELAAVNEPAPAPLLPAPSYSHDLAPIPWPKIITGAQRILPSTFAAYAELSR